MQRGWLLLGRIGEGQQKANKKMEKCRERSVAWEKEVTRGVKGRM